MSLPARITILSFLVEASRATFRASESGCLSSRGASTPTSTFELLCRTMLRSLPLRELSERRLPTSWLKSSSSVASLHTSNSLSSFWRMMTLLALPAAALRSVSRSVGHPDLVMILAP